MTQYIGNSPTDVLNGLSNGTFMDYVEMMTVNYF